ncbi:MAG: thiamine phosphate synthase [Bacteroidetes bacterium]|jgi:thiamine-phosphate pyrophosphorylase|nr:thiamine phosphate synthase [Bacteroidota bacterium]
MELHQNGTQTETSIGRLHVITDFYLQQRISHAELAIQAIEGGADVIQFRQKRGGIRNKLIAARKLKIVCEEAGVPLIINDHLNIAQALGAGAHLGQDDFPLPEAREILGSEVVIGATATTAEQARQAYEEGADYIGFGPVFTTQSKFNRSSTKGVDGLAAACDAVPIPVIAIAGITSDRVQPALDAGAHGVAVLSAVATAESPKRATARIRAALDDAVPSS